MPSDRASTIQLAGAGEGVAGLLVSVHFVFCFVFFFY
jgi:hypothetical protein